MVYTICQEIGHNKKTCPRKDSESKKDIKSTKKEIKSTNKKKTSKEEKYKMSDIKVKKKS